MLTNNNTTPTTNIKSAGTTTATTITTPTSTSKVYKTNFNVVLTTFHNGTTHTESHVIENPITTENVTESPIKLGASKIKFKPDREGVEHRLKSIAGPAYVPSKKMIAMVIALIEELGEINAFELFKENGKSVQKIKDKAYKLMKEFDSQERTVIDTNSEVETLDPQIETLTERIKTDNAKRNELIARKTTCLELQRAAEEFEKQIVNKLPQLLYAIFPDLLPDPRYFADLSFEEIQLAIGYVTVGVLDGDNDKTALCSCSKDQLERALHRLENFDLTKNPNHQLGRISMRHDKTKVELIQELAKLLQIPHVTETDAAGNIVDIRDPRPEELPNEKRERDDDGSEEGGNHTSKKRRVEVQTPETPEAPKTPEARRALLQQWGMMDENGNLIKEKL